MCRAAQARRAELLSFGAGRYHSALFYSQAQGLSQRRGETAFFNTSMYRPVLFEDEVFSCFLKAASALGCFGAIESAHPLLTTTLQRPALPSYKCRWLPFGASGDEEDRLLVAGPGPPVIPG